MKNKKTSGRFIATAFIITGVGVLGGSVAVDRLQENRRTAEESMPSSRIANDWREVVRSPSEGWPPSGVVPIVLFIDLECPFCSRAHAILESVQAEFAGRIRIYLRHLPLSQIHANAKLLAKKAECAEEFGFQRPFVATHFAVDGVSGSPRPSVRLDKAVQEYLSQDDRLAFESCVLDPSIQERVERDSADARALGINGTPAILIGDALFEGVVPEEILRQQVLNVR